VSAKFNDGFAEFNKMKKQNELFKQTDRNKN